MNVERLHVIVLAIHKDLKETNVINSINNIVSNLKDQISSPSEPSYQENVSKGVTGKWQETKFRGRQFNAKIYGKREIPDSLLLVRIGSSNPSL